MLCAYSAAGGGEFRRVEKAFAGHVECLLDCDAERWHFITRQSYHIRGLLGECQCLFVGVVLITDGNVEVHSESPDEELHDLTTIFS